MGNWAWKLILAAVALAYGVIGSMSYDDAAKAHEHACQMVAAGYWPEQFCMENDGGN